MLASFVNFKMVKKAGLLSCLLAIGFACQKKNSLLIHHDPQEVTLGVSLQPEGYLFFPNAALLEQYLEQPSLLRASAFAQFSSYTHAPHAPAWTQRFSHLAAFFNHAGLLQVGEKIFSLQADGIYARLLSPQANWVLVRSVDDLALEAATYGLTVCASAQKEPVTATTYPTRLDDPLADLEDYFDKNADTWQEIVGIIAEDEVALRAALLDPSLPSEDRTIIEALLRFPNLLNELSAVKNANLLLAQDSKSAYYLNTVAEEKHADFIHLTIDDSARITVQSRKFLQNVGNAVACLFGSCPQTGPSTAEITQIVLTSIEPALTAMAQTMAALTQNVTLLTQTVNILAETMSGFSALLSNQQQQITLMQQQINLLFQLLIGNKPHYSPSLQAFKGGKDSPMVKFLVQNAGLEGTAMETMIESFGTWVEKQGIGETLDRSFAQDLSFMADNKGKQYFHLWYAYKDVSLSTAQSKVYFKRYIFRTAEDFDQVESVNGLFHQTLSSDVRMHYQNELGFLLPLTQKTVTKNGLNYPEVAFELPIRPGVCVQNLYLEHQTRNTQFNARQSYSDSIQVY